MHRILLSLPLVWILLTGCMPDLTSERPPERIYWLEPATIDDPPPVNLRLGVVPGLDSDRIWVLEADQRLNFYAGAHWPDNLQPLLESLVSRSLNADSRGRDIDVLIERFFAVSQGEAAVPRIELAATLASADDRCRFERSQSSGSGRLRDIVAGHQALLDSLTDAVADFARTGRCP
jgi:hypothetical protein